MSENRVSRSSVGEPGVWPAPDVVESIRADLGGRRSKIALVLGSGLGGIADQLEDRWTRSGSEIPGYPESTVAGHHGRLHFGRLGSREAWVVQGRVHLYEGHTPEVATRYVRLLQALGVETLVLTNAAGSVDTRVGPGEIVIADDAISLFFRTLARPGVEPRTDGEAGWRIRSAISDPGLVELAEAVALERGIPVQRGVLIGSPGPTYETASEIRLWRKLGGTVASMSTVPEAIQARELGMRVLLFSLVTNLGTGLSREQLTHEDVVEQANRAGARLGNLLTALVPRI